MTRAYVLGGGVAGIAAAFALRDRGHEVELLEQHGWLGGRAFSFDDTTLGGPAAPVVLDNGPHVLLGCYDQFRALLRRLGTEDELLQPRTLALHYRLPGGGESALRLAPLPVPLALPPALLALRSLPFGARLRAVRGLLAAPRRVAPELSVEDWIRSKGQHGAVRDHLWDPLCRAVMNAEPEQVSAQLFLRTITRAFGGSAARAAIWLPRRPWREVLGEPARRALVAAGVTLRFGARVVALAQDAGRVTRIVLGEDGRAVGADELVVSALPAAALGRLLGPQAGADMLLQFATSPIVAVCFQGAAVPRLQAGVHVVCLVGGAPFHFLYRTPGAPPGAFALIADGARTLDHRPVVEIEAIARAQLARYFPELGDAGGRARVTKEANATLLLSPAHEPARPEPGPWPGLANLVVCGDWTRTGLPCTLEGAADSARRALAR